MIIPIVSPAPAAAIAAKKRRHIIKTFTTAGALSAETARTLEELGLADSPLLNVQKHRGVVVKVDGDRYYLDEAREKEISGFRRKLLLTIGAVALIFLLIAWLSRTG